MTVDISTQVAEFIRCQAPEPKRWLRATLHGLKSGKSDIKALEDPLQGFYRARIRGYRIVFCYEPTAEGVTIKCIFAERRGIIYEVFSHLLADRLVRNKPM